MGQHPRINYGHPVLGQIIPILGRNGLNIIPQFQQEIQVQTGVPCSPVQGRHNGLYSRLGGPQGKWGQTGVHNVYPRLDGLQIDHGGHAARVVRVEVYGNADLPLEHSDKLGNIKRRHYASHVFETEGVCAHVLYLFGLAHIIIQIEYVASHPPLCQGIADCTLKMLFIGLYPLNDRPKIAEIIQGIKDPKHIHARFTGLIHK